MANNPNPRRSRLKCVAIAVCAFLVAACIFSVGYYRFLRAPGNVFDEIYWELVDANCERAVHCDGGWHYPGEYLYAYLDPCRTSGAVAEVMEWKPIQKRIWGSWLQPIMEEFEGDHNQRFESYYGRWEIPFTDMHVALESGEYISVDNISVMTEGTSSLLKPNTLCITISLEDLQGEYVFVEGKSTLYDSGTCYFIADLPNRTIDWEVIIPSVYDDDQVLDAMKDMLSDVFLSEYFEANPDSDFSMDDLGDWSWGEDLGDD